jgi:hypothetical protein
MGTRHTAPPGADEKLAVQLPETVSFAAHAPASPRENHANPGFQPGTWNPERGTPLLDSPFPALYGLFRAKKINKILRNPMNRERCQPGLPVSFLTFGASLELGCWCLELPWVLRHWVLGYFKKGAEFLTKAVHPFRLPTPPFFYAFRYCPCEGTPAPCESTTQICAKIVRNNSA